MGTPIPIERCPDESTKINTKMKYLHEILWLAAWPVVIIVSFLIVFRTIRRYEKREKNASSER
jgi:flagellar biosynthesis/type III secretory pathway M-ring protein FliF/YscJ